ncbi:hypothetical protein CW751_04705 [Brumimicrobium salinarum]|uniref:Lipoprotein n=1 Tax=Brumimicrobium salinarum TaxID=2058658 RepID=A0A2I0R4P6_9FLAO|nr:hypothetical protein [Brumimicrobium salinarum]PKR81360.1 hypothetical protein CW751_04705 [Brumimicrobium salinarum]
MRKITALLILTLFLSSCSDNLSNSKAEGIIIECLEKEPYRKTVKFQYGERLIYNKDKEEFEKLKKLEEDGLLKIDSLGVKKSTVLWKVSKL